MIIIIGSIVARPGCLDPLLALSLEHVRRSRGEAGCVAHAVHRDGENPLRLVFVEQWADREALLAHFALPASRGFVRSATELAAEAPEMALFEGRTLAL